MQKLRVKEAYKAHMGRHRHTQAQKHTKYTFRDAYTSTRRHTRYALAHTRKAQAHTHTGTRSLTSFTEGNRLNTNH